MTPMEELVRNDIKKWRDSIFTARASGDVLTPEAEARIEGISAVCDTLELQLNKATNPMATIGDIACGEFTVKMADMIEGAYEAVRVEKIIDRLEEGLRNG